jgi:hypothetical protein
MPQEAATTLLTKILNDIEQELPESERIPGAKLGVGDGEHQGVTFRVFEFPRPQAANEPYFVGIFDQAGERRVFLLEKTQNSGPIVIEWSRTQRMIYGQLPPEVGDNVEEFIKAVLILMDMKAAPSFTISRAPIFNTSLREFAVWQQMDASFAFNELRNTHNTANTTPPNNPSPWWKFWA